ncbi:MAG TPA: M56 family metallopeptidase, partial [Verrucomicrobiae bacterium]|nr:M56 family metallopeptidase [Verrucomicrobiae bacterium]
LLSMAKYFWLAGCVGMFALVGWRYQKLNCEVNKLKPVDDPRVLGLLENCQVLLGIKRQVRLLATDDLNAPALFGQRNPRLLLPANMLQNLEDREVQFIFLHELIHLRRGDVLVNWAAIFFRSLHWFNPAVWLMLKKLRADQELACDAAVISLIAPEERRLYGGTLVKLLDDFAAAGLCPSLVPFITNKHHIKRRITMIARFKPANRLVSMASLALLVALGAITFTRAADKKDDAPPKVDNPKTEAPANPPDESTRRLENADHRMSVLQKELAKLTDEVERRQQIVNQLRRELAIPNEIAEGRAVSKMDSEMLRHYEMSLMESEAQYVKDRKMLQSLKQLPLADLRNVIPTAAPDPLLNVLLEKFIETKAKLVSLKKEFGGLNPQVQSTEAALEDLNKQIDERVRGILTGMEMRIASLDANIESLKNGMESAKKEDIQSIEAYQPFFQAKRDLETLQKSRDALLMRLNEARVESNFSRVKW